MARVAAAAAAAAAPLSAAPPLRVRNAWRRRLRRLTKHFSHTVPALPPVRAALPALLLLLLFTLLVFLLPPSPPRLLRPAFDDDADMAAVEAEDASKLAALRNRSALPPDPNATFVPQARITWQHIYGQITRRPVPPVLTKYKTRLLRELLIAARLRVAPVWNPALDVSCNYLNDIPAPGGADADAAPELPFECMNTSHRCPDGAVAPGSAFVPAEGRAVTWDHVVLLVLVALGREAQLAALGDTWFAKLPPGVTVIISRDGKQPEMPPAIMARPNTLILEYGGPTGMGELDIKAFRTLVFAHERFAKTEKKYFIKVDDDTYLFRHNLMRFLNHVERRFTPHEQAIYFGHPFCGHGDLKALNYSTYCYAGGGAYGLSVEAVQNLITQVKGGCAYFYDYVFKVPNLRPENDQYGGRYEDIMVGRCLRQARIRSQLRGTSLLACGSFVPYAPLHYYERFGRTKEALAKKLDGDPITVHNLAPSAMRFMDQLGSDYPLNSGVGVFSVKNDALQSMIDKCSMNGKKMECELSE